MKNTKQTIKQTQYKKNTNSINTRDNKKLLEFELKTALGECSAVDFEKVIKYNGLTNEIIYLIMEYFKNDISKDDKKYTERLLRFQNKKDVV